MKYSRKQIEEAIIYWQRILEKYDSQKSKSPIIQELLKTYSKDVLYSPKLDFIPTKSDIQQIYTILNDTVFSNKLEQQDFLCLTIQQMSELYRKLNYRDDPNNYYAQYFPDLKRNSDVSGLPLIGNELFLINISNYPANLSFTISTICHEMIHKFDINKGSLRKSMKDYFENGILYEEHATSTWIEKSDFANSNGLTIIPNGNGVSIQKLCDLSAMRMKRLDVSDELLLKLDEDLTTNKLYNRSTAKAWKVDDDTYRIAFGN